MYQYFWYIMLQKPRFFFACVFFRNHEVRELRFQSFKLVEETCLKWWLPHAFWRKSSEGNFVKTCISGLVAWKRIYLPMIVCWLLFEKRVKICAKNEVVFAPLEIFRRKQQPASPVIFPQTPLVFLCPAVFQVVKVHVLHTARGRELCLLVRPRRTRSRRTQTGWGEVCMWMSAVKMP